MSNDKDDLDLNADDIEAMHAAGIPVQDYRWSLTTWDDIAAERRRLERIPTSKLTYIEALRLALVQQMLDLPPAHFATLNRSRYERLLDWITGRDPSRRGPRYPWVIAVPADRRVDIMPSNSYAIQGVLGGTGLHRLERDRGPHS